jgi:tetratricopeptide (TPR) repeat protein
MHFFDARIRDLSHGIRVYEWSGISERETNKKTLLEHKKKAKVTCQERLTFVDQKEAEAFACCTKALEFCVANHRSLVARVNRGLFYYLEGNLIDALAQLKAALNKIKKEDFERLQEEALLIKGQTELEVGLYADAVWTLTDLIKANPKNKQAYFD